MYLKSILNKTSYFVRKNYLLVISTFVFSIIVLPLCFANNDYLILLASEHIDSGSILGSIFQLFNHTNLSSFYNQNIPFHTLYGFPYNSLLFWMFFLIKSIFGLDQINDFTIMASIARLLNYIISLLIITEIYFLSCKLIKSIILKITLMILVIFFPPFIHYSYHIKPDLLGLLFVIFSFKYTLYFINNPKNIHNIILANIFGGLSILCKQPHIFIIFPLLINFIYAIKNKYKNNIKTIIIAYINSFFIFILLFFLIHPYAFLDIQGFVTKQQYLATGMTSSNIPENILSWISIYSNSPILLLIVTAPILFWLTIIFKKEKDKKIYLLKLISIYILTYITWLTIKVGPFRIEAYFIPVFPFSIILFIYSLNTIYKLLIIQKNRIRLLLYTLLLIAFSLLIFISTYKNITSSIKIIKDSYEFKNSIQYQSTKQFMLLSVNTNTKEKNIIHSISLPVSNNLFNKTENTWQFNNEKDFSLYKPDFLFIDFTVYWEKPYDYWQKIAQQNNLKNEIYFIKNENREQNIILFYK